MIAEEEGMVRGGVSVMFGKEKKIMRGKNLYLPHFERMIRRELKFRLQLLATPRL